MFSRPARAARASRISRNRSSCLRGRYGITSRRRFKNSKSAIEPKRRAWRKSRDGCERRAEMIVVTTEEVSGHRIVEMKGQVFGLVVRSRGLGGNIMAGLRSIGGGEITEYTELLDETPLEAIQRLTDNARQMGAN